MKEQIDDDEYLCEYCGIIIEKDEKIISRHNRICEKKEKVDNVTDLETKNQESAKSKFMPLTYEMIGVRSVSEAYRIEELDLGNRELSLIINKKNVDFADLLCLKSLNLSCNKLKDLSFLTFLGNGLKVLNIENNQIESLHFMEHLSELEILHASSNQLSIISSLAKLQKLKELKLDNNNLQYTTSTLKILQELNKLRTLTIFNNPFLNEIQCYKHIFIHKFKNLEKLDNNDITAVDVDLAKQYFDTNQMNKTWYNQSFKKEEIDQKGLVPEDSIDQKSEIKEVIKNSKFSPNKPEVDLSEYKNKTFILKSKPKEHAKITEPIKFKGTTITPIAIKKEHVKLNSNNIQLKHNTIENASELAQPQIDQILNLQNEIKLYKTELKQKDIKISGLETQIENLLNISMQLENQLDIERKEKEQIKLNNKQVVLGKDKQLKSEK